MKNLENENYEEFIVTVIFSSLLILICFYSGVKGNLQLYVSTTLILYGFLKLFSLTFFYNPTETCKDYKRFHDVFYRLNVEASSYKHTSVKLATAVMNFYLTQNHYWLLTLAVASAFSPIYLIKCWFSNKK